MTQRIRAVLRPPPEILPTKFTPGVDSKYAEIEGAWTDVIVVRVLSGSKTSNVSEIELTKRPAIPTLPLDGPWKLTRIELDGDGKAESVDVDKTLRNGTHAFQLK